MLQKNGFSKFPGESVTVEKNKWLIAAGNFIVVKLPVFFDWIKWNSEGIEFAQQIRAELPPFFDVWYRFQGEDKEDLHILVQEEENDEND